MWKRLFYGFLAFSLEFTQIASVCAQNSPVTLPIVVDKQAELKHKPGIDQCANGTLLIQIVRPNGAGISHNKYEQFNVGTGGVILNNADSYVSTGAGIVMANPHFDQGMAASVIINEVTSQHRTQLLGQTEIAGRAADYIVVNPNGIIVDGGSFIHTPHVTLTTGTPEFNDHDGSLKALHVTRGAVVIGANDVFLKDADYFDVIARTAEIQGSIHGDKAAVHISTGAHTHELATKQATPVMVVGESPVLGIDSSALGGIYAGKITLVCSEDGVGVKAPKQMVSRIDSTHITADGKIEVASVTAHEDLTIVSKNNSVQVAEHGKSQALKNLNISAKQGVEIQNNATVQAGKVAKLNAKQVTNKGQVKAGEDLDIKARDKLLNESDGKMISVGKVVLSGKRIENKGRISGSDTSKITARDTFKNWDSGKIHSQGNMLLEAKNFENHGQIHGQNLFQVQVQGRIQNAGDLWSDRDLEVQAKNLHQAGHMGGSIKTKIQIQEKIDNLVGAKIVSNGTTIVTSRNLLNQGTLASKGNMLIHTQDLLVHEQGNIRSEKNLILKAKHIHNSAAIESGGKTILSAVGDIENKTGSSLLSHRRLEIRAHGLTNKSTISGKKEVLLRVEKQVNNAGEIMGKGLQVLAESLDNAGIMTGSASFEMDIRKQMLNTKTGQWIGAQRMHLKGGSLENAGLIRGGNLRGELKQGLLNKGEIHGSQQMSLAMAEGVNLHKISSDGPMSITASGNLANEVTGVIAGRNSLSLEAKNIHNKGSIRGSGVSMASFEDIRNHRGVIYSDKDLRLRFDGRVINQFGEIQAEKNIDFMGHTKTKGHQVENRSGLIESQTGRLRFSVKRLLNCRDRIGISYGPVEYGTYEDGAFRVLPGAHADSKRADFFKRKPGLQRKRNQGVMASRSTQVFEGDPQAQILSAGQIIYDVDVLENKYSLIAAAGNIDLQGSPANEGLNLQTRINRWQHELVEEGSSHRGGLKKLFRGKKRRYEWKKKELDPVFQNAGFIPSTIQSEGRIHGIIPGTLIQRTGLVEGMHYQGSANPLRPSYLEPAPIDIEAIRNRARALHMALDDGSVMTEFGAIQLQGQIDALEYQQQLRQSPMFAYNPAAGHAYLIETRPDFVDVRRFLGSDYFLRRAMPNQGTALYPKRLGDALAETRFIRQQVHQQTGQRYLSGYGSDYEMIQALYDNATHQMGELQLTPGVSLTEAQVKQLNRDILWLEEVVIEGQTVLKPTLYLCRLTRDHMHPESAQILAKTIDLKAKEIKAQGLILARGHQTLDVSGDVALTGAHITGQHVHLKVGGDIQQNSSAIIGETVDIHADSLDVNRSVHRHGHENAYYEWLDGRSTIQATQGDLQIQTHKHLYASGAHLSSAKDMNLRVGGEAVLTSQIQQNKNYFTYKGGYYHHEEGHHHKSTFTAGGELSLKTAENATLSGVDMQAGKGLSVKADGRLQSITPQDYVIHAHKVSRKGSFGKQKVVESHHDQTQAVRNRFVGKDGVALESRGDNLQQAPQITSQGSVRVVSEEGVAAVTTAGSTTSSSYQKNSQSSLWVSHKNVTQTDETLHMAEVDAPGPVEIRGHKGTQVAMVVGQDKPAPYTDWAKDYKA
ncbi:MAG: filamentous hemagglutinin N-terminal domain-containing protein, partial [Alphaproteobacteria bacterium]|nr:filamentous hemagglutinin N-terminal domain-containing protein [Alphaproteobacteria bacterium]